MSDYARAAGLLRTVTADLAAAELAKPVPSCPGWTVSDVLTHVADNLTDELEQAGHRPETADVLAAYEQHLADVPGVDHTVLDLTLHAWDVGHALGRPVELDAASLDFLETFATAAGERLRRDEAFRPVEASADADRATRVLAAYGRTP
ncbi:hypothetical protein I601_3035 [Nocardioides dokdonensis FR1436]|uniref:Mycothiol-dependent maleylpyruvate isomerase metal-binding domain-containing protein n=1 Tax=Nocardioides dokdonensis FR1436 TaxID=1300347 RepID=A0A1A9GMZ4_9ACTN|nr:maleylpyruvate isomerase N-terminal domain-containing protein [Nocardioides dokdonensis]ANH39446.1 hypothetical protein I601_3035 [Nocardioides dokdonensis FR1436]